MLYTLQPDMLYFTAAKLNKMSTNVGSIQSHLNYYAKTNYIN